MSKDQEGEFATLDDYSRVEVRRGELKGEMWIACLLGGGFGAMLLYFALHDFTIAPNNDSRAPLFFGLWVIGGSLFPLLYRHRFSVDAHSRSWQYRWSLGGLGIRRSGGKDDLAAFLEREPQAAPLAAEALGRLGDELPDALQVAASTEWKRRKRNARNVALVVWGITLANAFLLGGALVCRWSDAAGTRFQWASSFWREESHTETRDGKTASYSVWCILAGPVWGGGGGGSGKLAPMQGMPVQVRFSLDRLSAVEKRFDTEAKERKVAAERAALIAKRDALRQKAETRRAVLGASPNAAALNEVGNTFQAAGDWDQAVSFFTQALAKAGSVKDQTDALGSIATCYMAQNQEAKTVAALKALVALPGCDPKTVRGVQGTLAHIAERKGTLHERLLTMPGDQFPGEEFIPLGP